MSGELNYAISRLENAYKALKEGALRAKDELEKDGVIQRFEFTFELLWKTIKLILKDKGLDINTPKDTLKEAFRLGWIKEEKTFLDMMKDRNLTSHIYDKETSEKIFQRIKTEYIPAISGLIQTLEQLT
jgi:nucleotidyltransferase substrate binding protein (TIGR01987 family)